MDQLRELRRRVRKDFEEHGLDESDWKAYWLGYMSAIKRFGGR